MKIAVVTGASSGFGAEFVRQLNQVYPALEEIWVIARRKERLKALAKESKIPLRIFAGDLTQKTVYLQLKRALFEKNPKVGMLINAAGFGKTGTVTSILKEDRKIQSDMIRLNCLALSRMTFLCLPYIKENGRIINLASAAAFSPQPNFTVYAATKAYVLSFSRGLGQELKSRGIYVTAVCPGPADTEFFDKAGEMKNVLKKLVFADSRKVVRQALTDSLHKKTTSVYGMPMKGARVLTKLLPHDIVVKML